MVRAEVVEAIGRQIDLDVTLDRSGASAPAACRIPKVISVTTKPANFDGGSAAEGNLQSPAESWSWAQ